MAKTYADKILTECIGEELPPRSPALLEAAANAPAGAEPRVSAPRPVLGTPPAEPAGA